MNVTREKFEVGAVVQFNEHTPDGFVGRFGPEATFIVVGANWNKFLIAETFTGAHIILSAGQFELVRGDT